MDKQQLLAKFNPANAANLTAADLEEMRGLSDYDIAILAEAYPNQPTRRSYLRLYNTALPENKQLYPLSTWQNLRNARKFSNMKNLVPFDFITSPASVSKKKTSAGTVAGKTTPVTKKVVVDLSAMEAAAELTAKLKPAPKAENLGTTGNVEKKTTTTTKVQVSKTTKPAPAPKDKPAKSVTAVKAPAVDNPPPGASETFPPVE